MHRWFVIGGLILQALPVMAAEVVQRFDTDGDGHIDQWEYYASGALTRLEADRNHDQRVDHWVTYRQGQAVQAEFDTNGVGGGRPTRILRCQRCA